MCVQRVCVCKEPEIPGWLLSGQHSGDHGLQSLRCVGRPAGRESWVSETHRKQEITESLLRLWQLCFHLFRVLSPVSVSLHQLTKHHGRRGQAHICSCLSHLLCHAFLSDPLFVLTVHHSSARKRCQQNSERGLFPERRHFASHYGNYICLVCLHVLKLLTIAVFQQSPCHLSVRVLCDFGLKITWRVVTAGDNLGLNK